MGTDNARCTTCGASMPADMVFCERCGSQREGTATTPVAPEPFVQPAIPPAEPPVEATMLGASLDATMMTPVPQHTAVLPPVPAFDGPPLMPPPPMPPPGAPMGYEPPRPMHPLVLIPALGLLAMIGVLHYQLRHDWRGFTYLFRGGLLHFATVLASLGTVVLMLAMTATAVAIIVGLMRGRGAARIAAMTWSVGVMVAEIMNLSLKGTRYTWVQETWIAPVMIAIAVVTIVALMPYPGLQRFFAPRGGVPLGISVGRAFSAYFGWNVALLAVVTMVAGGLSEHYLYWGFGYLAIAVLLLVGNQLLVRWGLAGSIVASVMFAAFMGVTIAMVQVEGGAYNLTAILGLVVSVVGIGMLWIPSTTRALGAGGPRGAAQPAVATVLSFVLLAALGVGGIVVGSMAKSKAQDALDSYNSSSYTTPDYTTPDYSTPDYSDPTDAPAYDYSSPTDTPTDDYSSSSNGSDATYTNEWTTTATATSGYTEEISFQAGEPQHYTAGMQNGDATAGAACSIDATTDAVVPAKITMTNTTPNNFGSPLAATLSLGSSWTYPQMDVHFSDTGDVCKDSSLGTQSVSPAASGASIVTHLYFVVSNYYTPDYPDGDPSVLANATLALTSASVTDDSGSTLTFTPGSVSGPGVTAGYGESYFPLVP